MSYHCQSLWGFPAEYIWGVGFSDCLDCISLYIFISEIVNGDFHLFCFSTTSGNVDYHHVFNWYDWTFYLVIDLFKICKDACMQTKVLNHNDCIFVLGGCESCQIEDHQRHIYSQYGNFHCSEPQCLFNITLPKLNHSHQPIRSHVNNSLLLQWFSHRNK